MLKRRIVPCLDVRDERVVKGIRFEGLRDAGDPAELGRLRCAGVTDLCLFPYEDAPGNGLRTLELLGSMGQGT